MIVVVGKCIMNMSECQMGKGAYEFFRQHPLFHNVGCNRTHREVCSGNNCSPATIAATPFNVGMICFGLYLPSHDVDYDFPTVILAISNPPFALCPSHVVLPSAYCFLPPIGLPFALSSLLLPQAPRPKLKVFPHLLHFLLAS